MAELTQCDNCGAVLAEEDQFCGECGAPRPTPVESAEVADTEQTPKPAPPVRPAIPSPSRPPEASWRIATIILVAVGAIACLAGVIGFLLVGLVGGETTTPQENWLYSTLCCLLPFGGTGAILAAVGAGIWYTRLRTR